jgi:hypothetical protein
MKFFKRPTESERMLRQRAKIINKYTEQSKESLLQIDEAMKFLNSVPTRSRAGVITATGSAGALVSAFTTLTVEYTARTEQLKRAGQDSSPTVVRALLDHGHQIINPHNMQLALPLLTATAMASLAYVGLVKLKQGFAERTIIKAKQAIAHAEHELEQLHRGNPGLADANHSPIDISTDPFLQTQIAGRILRSEPSTGAPMIHAVGYPKPFHAPPRSRRILSAVSLPNDRQSSISTHPSPTGQGRHVLTTNKVALLLTDGAADIEITP